MYTRSGLLTILATIVVVQLGGPAELHAQKKSGPKSRRAEVADEKPWYRGVSPQRRQKALELFQAGNTYLDSLGFAKATDKYREALAHWDHPVIHYNLTIALINLDDPVGAYRAVTQALRHGSIGLQLEHYKQARNYEKLLGDQLAELEIITEQPGVEVQLGGKPLAAGRQRAKELVLPGEHTIVATRPGYQTVAIPKLLLERGDSKKVRLKLFTNEELTNVRRHWKPWRPWALIGSGAAIVSIGGLLHWHGRANMERFDNKVFPDACGDLGCAVDDEDSPHAVLTRARWYQRLGVTGYAIGGAALTAGVILVYLNRPRTERLDRSDESIRISDESSSISIVPAISPTSTGMSLTGSF